jgi:hypothetical protein
VPQCRQSLPYPPEADTLLLETDGQAEIPRYQVTIKVQLRRGQVVQSDRRWSCLSYSLRLAGDQRAMIHEHRPQPGKRRRNRYPWMSMSPQYTRSREATWPTPNKRVPQPSTRGVVSSQKEPAGLFVRTGRCRHIHSPAITNMGGLAHSSAGIQAERTVAGCLPRPVRRDLAGRGFSAGAIYGSGAPFLTIAIVPALCGDAEPGA